MTNSKQNKKGNSIINYKWLITIFILTIAVSSSITFLSDLLLRRVNILVAFIILIFIILLGITFDIIGIAVTVASEAPFHAKASKKVKGARTAIKLIRNADKVASVCNDVVGDICGIVSGSIGALITAKIILDLNGNGTFINVLIGTLIGTGTIVGKSLGKTYAITYGDEIVFRVSEIISLIKRND